MVNTVDMWSDSQGDIVTWDVKLITHEEDDGDGGKITVPEVLLLTHGDEEQRYSPNTTEYELYRYVETANRSHGPGHSNREDAALAEAERNDAL